MGEIKFNHALYGPESDLLWSLRVRVTENPEKMRKP